MSLKAGRVGVNPADVDPIDGHISPSSVDSYTKAQADAKFQPMTLEVPIKYLNGSVLGTFDTVQEALSGSYGPDGAMTNKDLTDAVTPIESACTDLIEGATVDTGASGNKLVRIGSIVFMRLSLKTVTATAYSDNLAKIPSGYRPTSNIFVNAFGTNIKIASNGNIQSAVSLTNANVHIDTSWITD